MTAWAPVRELLHQGIRDRVFGAASALVDRGGRIVFEARTGRHDLSPTGRPVDEQSLFDLASLTKVLATVPAFLLLVDQGKLTPDQPLSTWLDLPRGLAELTPAHLLSHTSGLQAWRPFYHALAQLPVDRKRRTLWTMLLAEGPEARPGTTTVYSDLGFMLLQFLVESVSGQGLDRLVEDRIYRALGLENDLMFNPLPPTRPTDRFVASEPCPWRKRLLRGEVNDDNAHAAGGVAGQAGLFGTARAVRDLARWLWGQAKGTSRPRLIGPETASLIYHRPFPGQSRTLGFDVPEPGGSTGDLLGPGSIGHLGFTGTSLWHDPAPDLTVILLTNRTVFGRDNDRIKPFRIAFHNAVGRAMQDQTLT